MDTDRAVVAETFENVPATTAARLALLARGPGTLVARGGNARILKTETGKVVTHGEVLGGLLKRAEIEAEVVDGKRPEWIACRDCRAPVSVPRRGGIPKRCPRCSGVTCVECGANRGRTARGKPGTCHDCAAKTGVYAAVALNASAVSKAMNDERAVALRRPLRADAPPLATGDHRT